MSNRVDELETKVSELQAAVNGLTEELVETKERVRQLEDAVDVDDPAVRAKPSSDAATESDPDPEPAAAEESEADEEAEEAEPEQTFVDAEEHEQELSAGEDAKSEGTKEEETESEQDGSDIIVA